MRVSVLLVAAMTAPAVAGGLLLPGSGATSTSRAGAAVASADDGEALSINPAGLAKTTGWTLTISTSFIRYFMEFTRRGTYDPPSDFAPPYAGAPYPTVENDPKPPLGIAKFQPIPVIAVVTDLGGRLKNLRLAAGLYAPNGYPFRDMSQGYRFPLATQTDPDLTTPPPPTRYDILTQESRLLLPSLGASYRILPELDVGLRLTAGNVESKSQLAVWGQPFNVEESVRYDSLFSTEVKDSFIPAFGVGVAYRPTRQLEVAAVYNSPLVIKAKGHATSAKAPGVSQERVIGNIPDDRPELISCERGGTMEAQKACVNLQIPQTALIGARYKFLDAGDELIGDVELNVGWENWGKRCELDAEGGFVDPECTSPGQYRVVLDSGLYVNDVFQQPLEKNQVNYGLQDTFSIRLGGSVRLPIKKRGIASRRVTLRGGVAYDTTAAKTGWLRANFDGADRVTTTLGAAFRTQRFEISAGGGYVYEGKNTNPGASPDGSDCNPTLASIGCGGGTDRPIDERQGPDPTNPLLRPAFQAENPYNQGTFRSSYVLLMLGVTTWW